MKRIGINFYKRSIAAPVNIRKEPMITIANGTIINDEIVWARIAERSRLMIAYGTSENTVTKISKTAKDLNIFVM